ncbi:putative methylenetetrahydrofolate dehydrogenase (NADP(+)), Methenyltetrahydrofolate cyclohydrolase [Rosa chinensis]|uniref:Putative methylenetetrahydrofolate dehydrogenase (NADP(+)), Methenyltetrahydrofolate cyclohydrolase n=1 Tax=Rosa chinensis TaxID=74649 RepID=A0A2P6RHT1_ROSCH|nr:putative methylenetetrahydrofolate dehydrogenase (NADP(+)), Methenyltetrahydrofolate cyclohydrolase [Rosa chinensis]
MKKKNSIELMGVWRRLGTKAEVLYSTTFSSSWSTPLGLSRPLSSAASGNGQAEIMSGKPIAKDIRSRVAAEICRMKAATGRLPGLAVVLVGNRKDSHTYVHLKLKACNQVGIVTSIVQLPQDCTEARLIDVVSSFNRNPSVHGITVQLPLPQHLDEEKIINFVSPEKDVDGFHPLNMGNLAMRGREPLFIPCAPKACIELLLRYGVEIIGKNAVVIGRSKIVGLSTSLLLQRHHATVSTLHSFTKNPEELTRRADVVISDVGTPNLVHWDWLKPGAVVVDMGTNPVKDPSSRHGFRITGDVCYSEAIKVVSAITPVPGGVGPVVISMLLSNTLDSAKRATGLT